MCGRRHPTPLVGNVRKPGVVPWQERKSARGKPKTPCLSQMRRGDVVTPREVGNCPRDFEDTMKRSRAASTHAATTDEDSPGRSPVSFS